MKSLKRWIFLLAIVLSTATAATAGQKWALLVGIDVYQRPDVTRLQYAVADVKSVAQALKTYAGVPEDHLFVLTSDQSGDGSPTRGNVAFRLDWLKERVRAGDEVFFFFSGHGMEMDGSTYLLTTEADPRSAGTLKQTALSAASMQEMLGSLRALRLLVLIDACRSDPRAGRGSSANTMQKKFSRDLTLVAKRPQQTSESPVSATLFACQAGQRSYEWSDQGHGFFSYYLVQGLRGQAADSNGLVTLPRLLEYLDREVPKHVETVMGARQTPWMRAEGSGLATWTLAQTHPAAQAQVKTSSHISPKPHLTRSRSIDFDEIKVSGSGQNAATVLGANGITIADHTVNTSVLIVSERDLYEGNAVRAPSSPNMITQVGSNWPITYTLSFAAPVRAFSFTRAGLIAGPSGITHPEFTAVAYSSGGMEISRVSEDLLSSYTDVPPRRFTLAGPGIAMVRITSDSHRFAGFSGALLDDFRIDE